MTNLINFSSKLTLKKWKRGFTYHYRSIEIDELKKIIYHPKLSLTSKANKITKDKRGE
jgi:hypothetical protein